MTLYLDASVLVPLLLAEVGSPAVRALLVVNAGQFTVADFGAGEVGSAIGKAVLDRRMDQDDARLRLAEFDIWRDVAASSVLLTSADVAGATKLVRQFDLRLRFPDAIHAACCDRLGLALVTLDNRLADAGGRLGLKVIRPTLAD